MSGHQSDSCNVCRMVSHEFVDDSIGIALAVQIMEQQMKESDPGIYDAGLLKFWESEAQARELLFALQEEQRRYYHGEEFPS